MQFKELNIIPSIEKALKEEGYTQATPVQEQAIPQVLAGRDLLASAQTGTGKTAAFAIPVIQMISEANKAAFEGEREKEEKGWAKKKHKKQIQALIITPTRELAIQIFENFNSYGKYAKVKACVITGGVAQRPQEEQLRRGVDVVIATPGRLDDLMRQNLIKLDQVKYLVLDETDRMLDMGFIHDVKKILAETPADKQILLFSATFPPAIVELTKTFLKDPASVRIHAEKPTLDNIEQQLYYVDKVKKTSLLIHLLKNKDIKNVIVFSRTKYGADKIVKTLEKSKITAMAIHGDKSQGARQRALKAFSDKSIRVLVATDIAARGIDINDLAYVINYDLPEEAETYIHRIGRTGRAGLSGTAISFCSIDEKGHLQDIERLLRKHLMVVEENPFPMEELIPTVKEKKGRGQKGRTSYNDITSSSSSRRKGGAAKKKDPVKEYADKKPKKLNKYGEPAKVYKRYKAAPAKKRAR